MSLDAGDAGSNEESPHDAGAANAAALRYVDLWSAQRLVKVQFARDSLTFSGSLSVS